jgi:hypothetical protein
MISLKRANIALIRHSTVISASNSRQLTTSLPMVDATAKTSASVFESRFHFWHRRWQL